MAGWRQAVELAITEEEIAKLTVIACSGSGSASGEAAQMLLRDYENRSFFAVGQKLIATGLCGLLDRTAFFRTWTSRYTHTTSAIFCSKSASRRSS